MKKVDCIDSDHHDSDELHCHENFSSIEIMNKFDCGMADTDFSLGPALYSGDASEEYESIDIFTFDAGGADDQLEIPDHHHEHIHHHHEHTHHHNILTCKVNNCEICYHNTNHINNCESYHNNHDHNHCNHSINNKHHHNYIDPVFIDCGTAAEILPGQSHIDCGNTIENIDYSQINISYCIVSSNL